MPETTSDSPVLTTEAAAVEQVHLRLGGRLAPFLGVQAVADYGSSEAELEALRDGVALIDRTWIDALELTGEDRSRFLGGQLTSDVAALKPGGVLYGLLVSAKGRVETDAVVLAAEDRLLLELPAGRAPSVAERLAKYIIVDRVEIDSAVRWRALTMAGPRAAEQLEQVLPGALPGGPWRHRSATVAGCEVWVAHQPLFRQPAFTLWVSSAAAADVLALLSAREEVTLVGWTAYEARRVELGWPTFGQDYGADCFPQECGLDGDAVSYTKGCYLGQEVVARIHYRGGVKRRLCQLRITGDCTQATGQGLTVNEREVGRLTSMARLSEGNLGLAILHQRAATGALLDIAGGGVGEVVELAPDSGV